MSLSLVPCSQIFKAHYGKALKKEVRNETGKHHVFGSSGQVGFHNESLINEPTIIIGRKGSVGEITYAPEGRWTIDTAYYVELLDKKSCDLRYLYYALRRANLSQHTITTSIPGLNRDALYSTIIPFPPLEEQKRITAILDKADAIRRKRQQAIDLTDQLLRSVFLDMFGDPVTNPKGWNVAPLGTLVKALEGGKNVKPDDSGRPTVNRVLKVSAVTYGVFRANESKPLPDNFEPPESYFVKAGDLLISRANTAELIGATAFVYDTPNNLVLPDKIWRFVWKKAEGVHPLYIHYLFKQSCIRREVSSRSSGTSGSMKNIPKPKLLEIPIPIPPVEKQNKFGEFVQKIQDSYNDYDANRDMLDNLFNSLTKNAFSGELSKQTRAA